MNKQISANFASWRATEGFWMKEHYVRSQWEELGITDDFFEATSIVKMEIRHGDM